MAHTVCYGMLTLQCLATYLQ